MNNIEKHRAFIESLEGENGLPEHFYRLLTPRTEFYQYGDEILSVGGKWCLVDELWVGQHVLPNVITRRAESRQIPDLKEKVKELMRDAMDIEENSHLYTDAECAAFRALVDYDPAFRALCAPDRGGEVKQ